MKRILLVLGFLFLMPSAQAQEMLPDDLQGDWGQPHQCLAQEEAGEDETVSHVVDSPYRFRGQWVSRWFFYCFTREVFSAPDGYRVRAMCGEDATERPWEIRITTDGQTMSMTWYAIGEHDGNWNPWEVGPLNRCDAPES